MLCNPSHTTTTTICRKNVHWRNTGVELYHTIHNATGTSETTHNDAAANANNKHYTCKTTVKLVSERANEA